MWRIKKNLVERLLIRGQIMDVAENTRMRVDELRDGQGKLVLCSGCSD